MLEIPTSPRPGWQGQVKRRRGFHRSFAEPERQAAPLFPEWAGSNARSNARFVGGFEARSCPTTVRPKGVLIKLR